MFDVAHLQPNLLVDERGVLGYGRRVASGIGSAMRAAIEPTRHGALAHAHRHDVQRDGICNTTK
jgi:hypothetical protein